MKCLKIITVVTVSLFMCTLMVGLSPTTTQADDTVKWKEINGIIPLPPPFINGVGSGTGQVVGGPLPTTTTRGNARVNLDTGHLRFKVRGLVIAASNDIGTVPAFVSQVTGTLVCDTDGSADTVTGNSVLVNTPPVDISPRGDAKFSGYVGPLPDACNEPDIAFLIVVPALNAWIANGAVRIP